MQACAFTQPTENKCVLQMLASSTWACSVVKNNRGDGLDPLAAWTSRQLYTGAQRHRILQEKQSANDPSACDLCALVPIKQLLCTCAHACMESLCMQAKKVLGRVEKYEPGQLRRSGGGSSSSSMGNVVSFMSLPKVGFLKPSLATSILCVLCIYSEKTVV
jgi:hypothetical protein